MILFDSDEGEARVSSPDNLVNKIQSSNIEIRERYSRDTQKKNLPPMIQSLVVAMGKIDTQSSAGAMVGVSQADVSYLTNKGKNVDEDTVKKTVAAVHQSALNGMIEAIGLLTPKLGDVRKARELSGIAADLSRVVNNTTPKEVAGSNLKVVVFSPVIRQEDQYEELVVVSGS